MILGAINFSATWFRSQPRAAHASTSRRWPSETVALCCGRGARRTHVNTVRIERGEHVWTVTIDRPEVRNAVDGPTARALAEAFRAFDADDAARVASSTATAATSAPAPT